MTGLIDDFPPVPGHPDSGNVVPRETTPEDKPPRRRRTANRTTTAKTRTPGGLLINKSVQEELTTKLNAGWLGLSQGFWAVGDDFCGTIVATRGSAVTDALVDLAKTDPRVLRLLQSATTITGWGALATASLMVGLPILVHHAPYLRGSAPLRNLVGLADQEAALADDGTAVDPRYWSGDNSDVGPIRPSVDVAAR